MGTGIEVINFIFTAFTIHYVYELSVYIAEKIEDVFDVEIINPDNKNIIRKIIDRIIKALLKE